MSGSRGCHVVLERLTKRFGAIIAVDDLSLVVPAGEITALLGPSGCGKTTTLRLIAGLLRPTSGQVRLDGVSQHGIPAEQRGAVMVFQRQLLFPYLSVADNVAFGLRMRGVAARERHHRVAEMLERVRLPGVAGRRPDELSGGQQQRVALARALVVEPRVLLLDEPLANLDAHLRDDMRALVRDIQADLEVTTVVVTHDQEEAVELADRIGLMFEGRLHQVGAPLDFYERPASSRAARFFGNTNVLGGTLRGGTVETPIGTLKAAETAVPDGPVTVTIRPEAVDLEGRAQPTNVVSARVEEVRSLGTHVRVGLRTGPVRLEAAAPPDVGFDVAVGAELRVALPPDRLWLIAASEDDPAPGG